MNTGLLIALVAGAALPIIVAIVIVQGRIHSMPRREQPQAEAQATRFGLGVTGGIAGALLVAALVIGLVLAARAAL